MSFFKQSTLPGIALSENPIPVLPEKIGPYKIESLLSKGGMSLLYLGLHPTTREPIAIKVLLPKWVNHPESVGQFLKETEIIGLTSHPNIVKLYGEGEWEGGLYIAMEFIRGISLKQFITQQSLSLKRSLEILLQVAYALCHLHSHGVIHRDLKPENILITEEGEIKVIDFGIAALHEETENKSPKEKRGFMGTPSYMSPEQKENPLQVTFASDIYSLGVLAYELILGKLSYGVINLSLLPQGLRRIIGKALAISVKERYQDIVDFITDISDYLKSQELEKDKPGSDQFKELIEVLQKKAQQLSPQSPSWPHVEIGIAKFKSSFGLYYDFFTLPNNLYAVLLSDTTSNQIDATMDAASLRGRLHTWIAEHQETFRLLECIRSLQKMLLLDPLHLSYDISLLLLDPIRDRLAYIACGFDSLIQISGTEARSIGPSYPPLGIAAKEDFAETIHNWNVGDTLILHTFSIKEEIKEMLTESSLLSADRQADSLLKKMALLPSSSKSSKAVISIQRIS